LFLVRRRFSDTPPERDPRDLIVVVTEADRV
jgi:hypothetical protein